MTFFDLKVYFNQNWKKVQFVYLFTTSNGEPEVNPIGFVIELVVKYLIVWQAC